MFSSFQHKPILQLLFRNHTTVHNQTRPGDEIARLAGQKDDRTAKILRQTPSPSRGASNDVVVVCLVARVHLCEGCFDVSDDINQILPSC